MPFFKKKSDKNQRDSSQDSKKRKQSSGSNKSSPVHPPSPSQIPNGKAGGNVSDAASAGSGARPKTPLLRVGSRQETAVGDLGSGYAITSKTSVPKYQSRLSKPLQDVLYDSHGALPYLIQYMASQGCPQLVQFWLAAESFGSITWTKLRTESLNTVSKSSVIGANSPSESQGLIPSNNASQQQNAAATPDLKSQNSTELPSEPSQNSAQLDLNEDCSGDREGSVTSLRNDSEQNASAENKDLQTFFDEERSKEVLRKAVENDAINIFTKYLGQDAAYPIGISDELRTEIIRKICREDGQVDPNCFVLAQEHVYKALQTEYFDSFLQSEYHCKYQVDVLTSGKVYLSDVLYNESSMFYFMEYIEQEGANDLLQFWLAADNFQRHLLEQSGQYDPIEAQNDAMVLYDRYFSLQATNPVGFSDAVRFEVECNICREDGPLPDCFATSLKIADNTLEKVYLRGFLSSEIYYKYLNELIHQIKNDQGIAPSPHTRRKRHNSDTSSEHSVGSQKERNPNTLLAEGTKKVQMKNKVAGDMRIDTGNFDPDILWQRPKVGGMSFGKVNELGQFIAECEPDPDVKKGKTSKLDKVKKWVTGEEHKAQEDMAWQIAQMIINDVSKQTLSVDAAIDEEETPNSPDELLRAANSQRKDSTQSS
ncbi:A-kinase anchor protein 10, mitochondrial-like [Ptychodera flava]|uniref:A-kinase anchor protein 10, mitochondrial-like n=1 Tax=Ptychodera flava TaxID=63121 RepID=UPI00396A6FCF